MKYKKKPVEIEAFQYGIDIRPDWFNDKVTESVVITHIGRDSRDPHEYWCEIITLEGIMLCGYGDYIIKGVKGELYPCKSDIFELTYEIIN